MASVYEPPMRFSRTDWLSGSGVADKTPLPLSRTSGKLGAYPQWQSRCLLEPVLGRCLDWSHNSAVEPCRLSDTPIVVAAPVQYRRAVGKPDYVMIHSFGVAPNYLQERWLEPIQVWQNLVVNDAKCLVFATILEHFIESRSKQPE